ncbi:hypothetical protein NKH41_32095 [Mesorhizobium sp. M1169]|uniref:hypothetical protein n=1 Tax=Mesorhizobium sp. M1169 TaxID=2957066 RepID=UPI00333D4088
MGIPRVKARIVQSAVKTLVEPIFEAQFWHVSYGFGPGRSTHGALSISAGLPSRINAAGIPGGTGYHIRGSSRETSGATLTTSTITM